MSAVDKKPRARWRWMTANLKVELALQRYEPLSRGEKPRKYPDLVNWLEREGYLKLAADDNGTAACKMVERAIYEAFAAGHVCVVRRGIIPTYERDVLLEEQLIKRFPALTSGAIVIRLSDDFQSAAISDRDRFSNDIHEQLGHAFATHVASTREFFRLGDIVAVGGGRGVHHAVAALACLEKSSTINIHIHSFSGSLSHFKTSGSRALFWDADDNAMLLAEHFAEGSFAQIQQPILCGADRRNVLLKDTHLGRKKFKSPIHGFFGIGLFDTHHYMYDRLYKLIDQHSILPSDTYAEGIWDEYRNFYGLLYEIAELSRKIQQFHEGYWPVAEIGNRFYFVEPPETVSLADDLFLPETPTSESGRVKANEPSVAPIASMDLESEKLKTAHSRKNAALRKKVDAVVRKLNQHLLNSSEDQLSSINQLTIIAGTPTKAPAIRTLLVGALNKNEYTEGVPKACRVCLDRPTAIAVLEADGVKVDFTSESIF